MNELCIGTARFLIVTKITIILGLYSTASVFNNLIFDTTLHNPAIAFNETSFRLSSDKLRKRARIVIFVN